MMRNRFDEQLALLNEELMEMGLLCKEAITKCAIAVSRPDASLTTEINALEERINRQEREVEGLCLRLLLRQQPVARDLRQISSALKMITDLERIGDQAEDIAEIVSMGNTGEGPGCRLIVSMAGEAKGMVTDSIGAYVTKDVALAWEVIARDDRVDELFDAVKRALAAQLCGSEGEAERALDMLMIAKYFERIGDHAVNIAEWVIYSVTGERVAGE